MEKHRVSRLSYLFAHLHLLSSYSFSSTLLSSNLSLLSASSLLCFSSVHIVGSLTSKLPSMIQPVFSPFFNYHNPLLFHPRFVDVCRRFAQDRSGRGPRSPQLLAHSNLERTPPPRGFEEFFAHLAATDPLVQAMGWRDVFGKFWKQMWENWQF